MNELPNSYQNLPTFTLSEVTAYLRRHHVACDHVGGEATVRATTIDSRMATPGVLFVCKGAAFKPAYLTAALQAGATAWMCEREAEPALAASTDAPHLVVDDMRGAMAWASQLLFDHPDEHLRIVGITGTKGKSTTSYMLASILKAADTQPTIIGSIDTDDGVEHFESENTTPEAPDLWRHLHNTRATGRGTVVMEASSQGFKTDRTLGLPFDIGCFLNIGRDHISPTEHPTFEDYFASKMMMFDQTATAVVGLDTDMCDEVLAHARHALHLVTFSESDAGADYVARNVTASIGKISFEAVDAEGAHPVTVGMSGLFNIQNALAAIACARLLGIGWDAIAAGLAHIRVPGRMELVVSPDQHIVCVVDYAHNELSFKTLFEALTKEYPDRRIISLFGAPGGKAYERRRVLPEVAAAYCDYQIYTEEDPANDRLEDILTDQVRNTPEGTHFEAIADRRAAIARAFEVAREDAKPAVVCLLAKGDERYQHRGNDFEPVESDLQIAEELLLGHDMTADPGYHDPAADDEKEGE